MRSRKSTRIRNEPDPPATEEKEGIKKEMDSNNMDTAAADEDEMIESELLPGPKGQTTYYDGKGYYYSHLKEHKTIRVLACCYAGCDATAEMALYPGAPISLLSISESHNHPPNPSRRERHCFLRSIKTRHTAESTPFAIIFQEEAKKNPIGASFFSFDKIEKHLKKKMTASDSVSVVKTPVRTVMKTRGRPIPLDEPLQKKRKVEESTGKSGNLSKKLELLKKSLQNIPSSSNSYEMGEKMPSERLPGPHQHSFVYHDGNGHYYKTVSISDNTRYLKCSNDECYARAVMRLEDNSPISLEVYSPPHNHPPQPKENNKLEVDVSSPKPVNQPTTKETTKTPRRPGRKKAGGVAKRASLAESNTNNKDPSPTVEKAEEKEVQEFSERKYSEKLSGPDFYHDFKGNYYFTLQVKDEIRFLRCLVPTCQAEARMGTGDNAEIQPQKGSRPHNHPPDLNTHYHDKISQLENQWQEWVPSERLPSLSIQYCCYYDGKGFYYHQTSQKDNIRYLNCVKSECPVRAHMGTQKDAPITISPLKPTHNHSADYTLRDALLFIDAVRVRVRMGTEPATAIQYETDRNPVGAKRVDVSMLNNCLDLASEVSKSTSNNNITEDEVDFMSCIKPYKVIVPKDSTDNLLHVQNHFSSSLPVLNNSEQNRTVEKPVIPCKRISQDNNQQENNIQETSTEKILDIKEVSKSEKVPAKLRETWLYHDGNGFYYCSKGITQDKRYLTCVVPKCGAQGWMSLERGAPITARQPHNHGPQPPHHPQELWFFHRLKLRAQIEVDIPFSTIYQQEAAKNPEGAALVPEAEATKLLEKLLMFCIGEENCSDPKALKLRMKPDDVVNVPSTQPAEKLPCPELGQGWQYHDGQGFYYIVDRNQKKGKTIYLLCRSYHSCLGRATMKLGKGASILLKVRHNHEPDLLYREICLFSHNIKRRTRDETTPISTIYAEEAASYPAAAATMPESKVKAKLLNIRKCIKSQVEGPLEGNDVDDKELYKTQSQIPSEVLQGRYKPVYHDGRGYYFLETFTIDNTRHLMCVEPHCVAQAKMGLEDKSPLLPHAASGSHNHVPDLLRAYCLCLLDSIRHRVRSELDKGIEEICKEEFAKEPIVAAQIPKESLFKILMTIRCDEENGINKNMFKNEDANLVEEEGLWCSEIPAESLPCDQYKGWVYHDSRGYYYSCHHTFNNRMMLRCCERGCDATARLDNKPDAAITRAVGSPLHNHGPNLQWWTLLQFLHRLKSRAHNEHIPLTAIFEQEARTDPEGAALIPKHKVKETLDRLSVNKYFKDINTEDLSPEDQVFNQDELFSKDDWTMTPCETLHCVHSEKPVYYNGSGFYYRSRHQTTNREYLMCATPLCKALAYITSDRSHIYESTVTKHNHKADSLYRDRLVLIHSVQERVLSETTPVDKILEQEVALTQHHLNPLGEMFLKDASIRDMMHRLRKSKYIKAQLQDQLTEDTEDNDDQESIVSDDSYLYLEELKDNCGVEEIETETGEALDWDQEYTEEEYLDEDRPEHLKPALNPPLEDNLKKEIKRIPYSKYPRSEKLTSRSNKSIYHNGEGFYFHYSYCKGDVQYMRCAEKQCKARGWMPSSKPGEPIIPTKGSPVHNHRPNLTRRKQLLFMHRCKLRAANENLTVQEIWDAEAHRDPVTASQISATNIKTQMRRFRIEHVAASLSPLEIEPAVLDSAADEQPPDVAQKEVAERIPSLGDETLWHAEGYFYSTYKTDQAVERVSCVEKGCAVKAVVTVVGPPSIQLEADQRHSHPPDFQRRGELLFMDRCKRRAIAGCQSVDDIYQDEASKEPEVADQLSASRVKQAMLAAKSSHERDCMLEEMEDNEGGDFLYDTEFLSEATDESEEFSQQTPESKSDCLLSTEEGSMVYHDGSGHFYKELSVQKSIRILKCIDCAARAKMALSPADAPIVLLDNSTQHTHAPDVNRMSRNSTTKSMKEEPKKPRPRLGPKSVKYQLADEDKGKDSDPDTQVDQRYTDYVTLEDEEDSYDQEAMNTDDDPDFNPSPKKYEEIAKLYHDDNGYCYTLVKAGVKRYLQCKAQCGVTVSLGPREKPLAKLLNTSLSHSHHPDQLVKQKLLLNNTSHRNSFNKSDTDEEYTQEEYLEDDNLVKQDLLGEGHPSELVHGRRPGSYNFHDGNGYYYKTHMVSDQYRYLNCVMQGCKTRAFMDKDGDNAPIFLRPKTPSHNHQPDFSFKNFTYFLEKCKTRALEEETPINQIYDEETALDPESAAKISKINLIQRMSRIRLGFTGTKSMPPTQILLEPSTSGLSKQSEYLTDPSGDYKDDNTDSGDDNPSKKTVVKSKMEGKKGVPRSEVLPGLRPNSTMFHDLKGHYYVFNAHKENKRYLRCIEPSCRVRAHMLTYDGAPIICSGDAVHNHRADFKRKNFVLFLQRCKQRAMDETTSIQKIYEEESSRDPVSAAMISTPNMIQRMLRSRKHLTSYVPTSEDQSEFMQACTSSNTEADSLTNETEDEELNSQDDDTYDNTQTKACSEEFSDEDPESEAIENAISQLVNNSEDKNLAKQEQEGGPEPQDQLQAAELLPGIRPNTNMYYDGRGYYYVFNTIRENVWYLRCVEPQCRVRAHMVPGANSPVVQSVNTMHNHRPDFKRKKFVLWMERLKQRAATEDKPISNIYAEEVARDPESANLISADNMKTRMQRARRSYVKISKTVKAGIDEEETGSVEEQDYASEKIKEEVYYVPKTEDHNQHTAEETKEEVYCDPQSEDHAAEEPKEEGHDNPDTEDHAAEETKEEGKYETKTEAASDNRDIVYVYQQPAKTTTTTVQKPIFYDESGYCYQQTTIQLYELPMYVDNCVVQAASDNRNVVYMYQQPTKTTTTTVQKPIFYDESGYCYQQTTIQLYELPMYVDNCVVQAASDNRNVVYMYQQPAKTTTTTVHKPIFYDESGYCYQQTTIQLYELPMYVDNCVVQAASDNRDVVYMYQQPAKTTTTTVQKPIFYDESGYCYQQTTIQLYELPMYVDNCVVQAASDNRDIVYVYQQPAKTTTTTVQKPIFYDESGYCYQQTTIQLYELPMYVDNCVVQAASDNRDVVYVYQQPAKTTTTTVQKPIFYDESDYCYQQTTIQLYELPMYVDNCVVQAASDNRDVVYVYQQPAKTTTTTVQKPIFYDESGYCYQQTTIRSLVRYLKCVEPTCKARASMNLEEEDTTIVLNKQCSHHNHEPEPSQITMLLDIDGQLVNKGNIQVIYTDENGGEQVALCHITDTQTQRKRPYRQRQMPELTIDPDEPVDSSLTTEVDVAAGDYYHNEDQQRYPVRPSEVIPGLRPDANNYHDGNGFYYELNRLSQNIRYLKCLIKDCKARAYMDTLQKNAPIIQTNFARHNHGPDLFRKQFTVFLHRVTRRAAMEDTPINTIYQQEAERDPTSASQIRMENVKQRMLRFRKKHRKNFTGVEEERSVEGGVEYQLVEGDLGENYYIQYGEEDDGGDGEQSVEQLETQEDDESSMYTYVISEVEVESSQQQQSS